jgi:hypothetical protein
MRFRPSMNLGVLGPALGLGAFVFSLQIQVSAMPAMQTALGVDPASINRTLKSDRLPAGSVVVRAPQQAGQSRLPEGCIEASNWNRDTMWDVEIPGRCIG